MRAKTTPVFLAAYLSIPAAFGATPAPDNTPHRPNVLFIAIDDLNDWCGYLGGHPQARTPHIDALANEGASFLNAYCPAPVCGPSRTALLYGISPHKSGSYGHHDIYHPKNLLPQGRLPLNLAFQQNGYHTAGCGKIFHFPEPRGWQEYVGNFPGIAPANREKLGAGIELSFGILETDDDRDTSDGKLADWAIAQLQRDHDRPFFIALGLRKPHLPWDAPRKYYEQFDLGRVRLPHVPEDDLDDLPAPAREFAASLVGFGSPNDHHAITAVEGAWPKLVRAYLATCSFADANVGRLLDALKKSPHADDTIVVLWGDHGWHLGEKSHWRKMTLWERGTRTPLIIKVPGAAANGTMIEAPVSLQDIYPTLVDLCRLTIDQELDGHSLRPLLANPAAAWDRPALISHGPGNFAVRKGPWRLIRYADGSEELYDLAADPGEWTNLALDPTHDRQREELRRHVPRSWRYLLDPRFESFSGLFARPPAPAPEG